MKKSKLAQLAMLGMASSFCLSAQDASSSEQCEVAMHKKSEEDYHSKSDKSSKGKKPHKSSKSGKSSKCNSKSGCSGKESTCGGPGGCSGKKESKESKCNSKGSCNHSSYNEADDSYQALRAKRYRNSEGK